MCEVHYAESTLAHGTYLYVNDKKSSIRLQTRKYEERYALAWKWTVTIGKHIFPIINRASHHVRKRVRLRSTGSFQFVCTRIDHYTIRLIGKT